MQIGNSTALDSARHALRDAFDETWMAETAKTPRAQRAAHCAGLLSECDYSQGLRNRYSTVTIGHRWRTYSPAVIYA